MFGHIDCNNFYVSCERVFNPALQGFPVVVLSNNDGCIIARSLEAKRIGITMGQPRFKAERLLREHDIKVLSSNYTLYGDISRRVMDILTTHCKAAEIYSIDEAFVELPIVEKEDLLAFAADLREKILKWTGIPVGIGIAPTKTLAKVANHLAKKAGNGLCCIVTPEAIEAALADFPVEDVWGVGASHAWNLKRAGITTAKQLRDCEDRWVKDRMTVSGLRTVHELRGNVCIPLAERPEPRNEVVVCRTFSQYLQTEESLLPAFAAFANLAAERLRRDKLRAQEVTVFLETNRFNKGPQCHSSVTLELDVATSDTSDLVFYANEGLKKIFQAGHEYKKGGIILSKISPAKFQQTTLFSDAGREDRSARLMKALDEVNATTAELVKFGTEADDSGRAGKAAYLSPKYTTRWADIPEVA